MPDYQEQTEKLDSLRKKARMSYFYLGCSLLFILAAMILLDAAYTAALTALVILLYVMFLRKDIRRYSLAYREIITCNSVGRHLQMGAYIPKNALTLQQVWQDGAIPAGTHTQGIVRAGASAFHRGRPVCMSDISYTFQAQNQQGHKRVFSISGCYIRLELQAASACSAVFFCRDVMPLEAIDTFFAQQELHQARCSLPELDELFYCYLPHGTDVFENDRISRALLQLNQSTHGQIVLKLGEGQLFAFFGGRYLGMREPDYKKSITEAQVSVDIFPELAELLEIAELCSQNDENIANCPVI